MMVQTGPNASRAVKALVAGRSDRFLAEEAATRKAAGFPPYGELIAVEVAQHEGADKVLRESLGDTATVLGPAPMQDRDRWLIQGEHLDTARIVLRTAVGLLRARGAKVRVDADPIDL